MFEKQYYFTRSDLSRRGWTTTPIRAFLGAPDKATANPFFPNGHPIRLYEAARVLALEQTMEFRRWLAERKKGYRPQITQKQVMFARTDQQYGCSWEAAIADGCRSLFNLNRFAKHVACSRYVREEIYRLKNPIIEILYRNGFCTDCYLHRSRLPSKPCSSCAGTGCWLADFEDDFDDSCMKCGGTGIYRPEREVIFVCFKFAVGGETYCWHQPQDIVRFQYSLTRDESSFDPQKEQKPVELGVDDIRAAKDLLRWIIERSRVVVEDSVTPNSNGSA